MTSYFCDLLKSIKNDNEIIFNEICGKISVSKHDCNKRSFLHNLCSNTYINCNYDKYVKLLVKNGVDINAFDDEKNTALHISTLKNNIKYVNALLKNGANSLIKNNFNRTPIYIACINDNHECINLFFLNKLYKYDDIIGEIEIICVYGYLECLKIIVNYIKIQDINISCLDVVCANNHSDCFNIFISGGMDLNIKNNYSDATLLLVVYKNNIKYVKKLIDNNADLNIQNNDKITPLLIACDQNNIESVTALIDAGAHLNMQNNDGNTAIMHSCNSLKCTLALINTKADVTIRNNKKETALMFACCHELECTRALINIKIDLNEQSDDGSTALILACRSDKPKIVSLLIDLNTDLNISRKNGDTALHECQSKTCINLLVNAKINLNIINNEGNNALMCSFKCENSNEHIHALIESGIDINKSNNKGECPLFLNDDYDILIKLIQYSVNINVKNQNGEPYIMCKTLSDTKWFNFEFIQYLIKLGINLKATNNNMQTTLYKCFENDMINKSTMLFKLGINIKYELYNANKIINCKNNYTKKKYIEELTKYHNIELKLKYEFMYIICSNSIKHELTRFFKLNKGLRGNIGGRIIGYINAF